MQMPHDVSHLSEARAVVIRAMEKIVLEIRRLAANSQVPTRRFFRWEILVREPLDGVTKTRTNPAGTVTENIIHALSDVAHNWPAWIISTEPFFTLEGFAADLERLAAEEFPSDQWRMHTKRMLLNLAEQFRRAAAIAPAD